MNADHPYLPFQSHSQESADAAASMKPVTGRCLVMVLKALSERDMTDEEGIAATGLSPSTYRPRRVDLWDRGLIVKRDYTRTTLSGRQAAVWGVK